MPQKRQYSAKNLGLRADSFVRVNGVTSSEENFRKQVEYNVWFQKISIPPPRRVFSSLTPHPTGFSVPEGLALLPLPPGISMIFSTWSLVPFGNSESKKKDLIYFDLLRAVIKIKFS